MGSLKRRFIRSCAPGRGPVVGAARFLLGTLPFPDAAHPLSSLPAAYRDAAGSWHGGAYNSVLGLQVGQLLRTHATRGGPIDVPIPGKARMQGFKTSNSGWWKAGGSH